jgi:hypothetical protein
VRPLAGCDFWPRCARFTDDKELVDAAERQHHRLCAVASPTFEMHARFEGLSASADPVTVPSGKFIGLENWSCLVAKGRAMHPLGIAKHCGVTRD